MLQKVKKDKCHVSMLVEQSKEACNLHFFVISVLTAALLHLSLFKDTRREKAP